ncbi:MULTISPECIES: hypothetical protein [Psychroflexus]|uniref:Uncharacterized protein n=1 Tax=Psychroflexus halocasei TaxID=908615 RepID=A0A1H4DFP1_9FLAO|nr:MULTISPECIES: hypothetical protein [Psychroflexus]PJX21558.1 hypothetical protein CAP47_07900 [Psychroflexus sp. S27]SEA71653.1 hypothetical protein SAMN05421540_11125 [Psychroflexus halocasei]
MKYLIYFLILFASFFLIYNLTLIDYSAIFSEGSFKPVVSAIISVAAIFLLLILILSKKISSKYEDR